MNFMILVTIQFIAVSAMKVITELRGKPLECESIHLVECPCFFGFVQQKKRERYFNIIERWQQVLTNVSNMKEFNKEVMVIALRHSSKYF